MPKILITGNGFDLFHHLPTKYGHFMAIMKTIEECNFEQEVSFEDLFGEFFKTLYLSDFNSIVENYNFKNIIYENHKLNEIRTILRLNSWYNHFKSVLEIETWIDFESEIERILIDVSIILEGQRKNGRNFNFYRKDTLNVFSDLECFGFIENNGESEVELKEKFLDIKNKKVRERLILNELFVSLEEFTSLFNSYLIEIVRPFYRNFRINQMIPFNLIDKIFTVNYTTILEEIYKVQSLKIVYLHGKENVDVNLNNLVLGVNDIPDGLKSIKCYYFTKYYQKIIKNSNPKFIEIVPEKINNSIETIFYIIGHSLDKSDKVYLLDLFKFLELDTLKKSRICVFYHSKSDKENKLNNLFSIVPGETLVKMNEENRLYFVKLDHKNISIEFSRELYKRQISF